jgi:hypothetical protein
LDLTRLQVRNIPKKNQDGAFVLISRGGWKGASQEDYIALMDLCPRVVVVASHGQTWCVIIKRPSTDQT